MKVVLSILLTTGLVSCEVPPYQDRGFRPSPPFNLPSQSSFNNIRQPQTTYGAPNPPKQTLPPVPQTQYGVPNTQNTEPSEGQLYKPPSLTPNFNSKQTIPGTSYGVPAPGRNFKIVNSLQQSPFIPPSKFTTGPSQPQEQYGPPNPRNIETFEEIRQLQLLLQAKQASLRNKQNPFGVNVVSQSQNSNRDAAIPTRQYLPVKEAENFNNFQQTRNSDRRPDFDRQNSLNFGEISNNGQQPSQQYLPVKEPLNFGKGLNFAETNAPRTPNFNAPGNSIQSSTSGRPDLSTGFANAPSQDNQDDRSNVNVPPNQYVPSNPTTNFQELENNPNFNSNNIRGNPLNAGAHQFQQSPSNSNFNRPLHFSTASPLNPQRNVDVQQLDVRLLNPSNVINGQNTQSTQVSRPGLNPVPNRDVGRANSQQTNREASDKYLPPTTTPRSTLFQTKRPTISPQTPTEAPEDEEESTASDDEAGGPNIAVATAVAGAPAGQSFYLLQPDGRLQRVIYQRNRDNGDQENEYTANYHFQNIQADPNIVYSPLLRLGK